MLGGRLPRKPSPQKPSLTLYICVDSFSIGIGSLAQMQPNELRFIGLLSVYTSQLQLKVDGDRLSSATLKV